MDKDLCKKRCCGVKGPKKSTKMLQSPLKKFKNLIFLKFKKFQKICLFRPLWASAQARPGPDPGPRPRPKRGQAWAQAHRSPTQHLGLHNQRNIHPGQANAIESGKIGQPSSGKTGQPSSGQKKTEIYRFLIFLNFWTKADF